MIQPQVQLILNQRLQQPANISSLSSKVNDMGANLTLKKSPIAATHAQKAQAQARLTPAAPEEGVRLIHAFVRIRDAAVREAIIDWVSEQARHS